jgi:hypothetical protein
MGNASTQHGLFLQASDFAQGRERLITCEKGRGLDRDVSCFLCCDRKVKADTSSKGENHCEFAIFCEDIPRNKKRTFEY